MVMSMLASHTTVLLVIISFHFVGFTAGVSKEFAILRLEYLVLPYIDKKEDACKRSGTNIVLVYSEQIMHFLIVGFDRPSANQKDRVLCLLHLIENIICAM